MVIVITAVGAFFLGSRAATHSASIRRVTATEIANAMKDDRFYSDYGDNALVVVGTISSTSTHGNDVIATLKADSSFQVLCDLGTQPRPQVGDHITVLAQGSDAQRQQSAVLLTNCVVP